MTTVRIAGATLTHFGSHPSRTGRDLFAEAALGAREQADIPRDDIDEVTYGNFMGELSERQGHQGPIMAEAAGLNCPATRYEDACASAGVAVRAGVSAIRSGRADVVLAGGMERMTNQETENTTEFLAIAADELYEVRAGMTFPGAYALMQRAYMNEFGGEREDFAHIAVKNHDHALPNEYAQYRSSITVDDHLDAPMISDPVGLYDSCPITDGAAAVVLCSEEYADEHDVDAPIAVTGTGQGGDKIALQDRVHLNRTPATERAAAQAFSDAGITHDDVAAVEVHDCFTVAEVLALEGLGFYEPGEAVTAARDGETTKHGPLPVNLSGGLKAKGHPVGATGASQVVEMYRLLTGTHPNSEYVDGSVGVTHNAGGTVASAVVHVLEEVEA